MHRAFWKGLFGCDPLCGPCACVAVPIQHELNYVTNLTCGRSTDLTERFNDPQDPTCTVTCCPLMSTKNEERPSGACLVPGWGPLEKCSNGQGPCSVNTCSN